MRAIFCIPAVKNTLPVRIDIKRTSQCYCNPEMIVVRRAGHCAHVDLPFTGVDPGTRKLAVVHMDQPSPSFRGCKKQNDYGFLTNVINRTDTISALRVYSVTECVVKNVPNNIIIDNYDIVAA